MYRNALGEERDQDWSIVILGSEGGELPSGPHNIWSIIIMTMMRMLVKVMTTMFMMLMMMVFLGRESVFAIPHRKCEASQSNAKCIKLELVSVGIWFAILFACFKIWFCIFYAVFLRMYICNSSDGNVKPVNQKLNTTWNWRRGLKTGVWNKIVQNVWIVMKSWRLKKAWQYVLWQYVQSGRNAM